MKLLRTIGPTQVGLFPISRDPPEGGTSQVKEKGVLKLNVSNF